MKIDLSQPESPPEPAPIYTAKEVKITHSDPLYLLQQRAKDYAEKYGFQITNSLAQAMQHRYKGEKFLSIREADIAARKQLDLTKEFLVTALVNPADVMVLVEDVAGLNDSVYELRSFYNRGVQFFSSGKANAVDRSQQYKAKEAMRFTIIKLREDKKLPAWPEEVEKGFPLELCKPDFMSWDQYHNRMKNPITMDIAGEAELNPHDQVPAHEQVS